MVVKKTVKTLFIANSFRECVAMQNLYLHNHGYLFGPIYLKCIIFYSILIFF